jgi:putative PEP-CTERM system TPR-repeat lipoprotein
MRQGDDEAAGHPSRLSGTARRAGIALALLSFCLALFACSGPDPDRILASGRQALEKGEPAAAILHLKAFIEIHPEHHQARYLLGRAYLGTGQANAAEVELRRAVDLGAAREQVLPALARALLMQGRFQPLLDEIPAEMAEKTSDPVEIVTLRGHAHIGMNRLSEAQAEFERAIARSPAYPGALLGLAAVALRQQRIDDAADLVERALQGDPRSVDALLLKAATMQRLDRTGEAASTFERLLNIAPDNAPASIGLARLQIAEGKLEAAAKLSESALAKTPAAPDALTLRALIAYRRGDGASALAAITAAMKARFDDPEVVVLAGAILHAQADHAEAARVLLRVLDRSPRLALVRKLQGAALLRSGQPLSAIEVLVPTLRMLPDDPVIPGLIAQAHALSGEMANAREQVERALALAASAPKSAPAVDAPRLPPGLLRSSDIDQALGIDAGVEPMRRLLALILIRQRQFGPALALIVPLEQAHGPDPELMTFKGVALGGNNDLPAARKAFEHALALKPGHVPAAFELALLDLRDGDPFSATRRLEKLAGRHPDSAEALIALMAIGVATGATQAEFTGWLRQAGELKTGRTQTAVLIGNHHLQAGDPKNALSVATDAYQLARQDVAVLRLLGSAQLANGQAPDAVTTFSQLLGAQPSSPEATRLLGRAHLASGNTAAALLLLRKAASLAPGNADILLDVAEAEARAGRMAEALAGARAAQKATPRSARPFVLEGDILTAQGRGAEAGAAYEQAVARRRGLDETAHMQIELRALEPLGRAGDLLERWLRGSTQDTPVHAFFGNHLLAQGRTREAVAEFEAVLRHQPRDAQVLSALANGLAQLKDPRAAAYAEQAYALNQNDPFVLDTLGWLLVERGELARGTELLERAVTLDTAAPRIRFHLAQAHVKAGNRARARRELELLLAYPTFRESAQVKQLLADLNR